MDRVCAVYTSIFLAVIIATTSDTPQKCKFIMKVQNFRSVYDMHVVGLDHFRQTPMSFNLYSEVAHETVSMIDGKIL